MQTAAYVQGLIDDLLAIAAVGGEEDAVDAAARRLARALESSAAQRIQEAIGDAAVELSAQLPSGHVEVRLVGRDPDLVYVDEAAGDDPVAGAEASLSARITLRLPDALKAQIEAAATRDGVSANTWMVRALSRSLTTARTRVGNRLTGFTQG